ncbi:hypothetical protein [Saccharophagus degradans]|uniref:Uncharacterized protein n=1 Tax=Saccharophagus degradans (strain 2-40 / ATCC 43961 / DSM 17024) TaxID=203122 RepID=Q21PB0_SACD2|nr:hypothetical protein [Saccharophagus degradans]ABD79469.1 hypothetical protein Sde_0205 [Saccharophagus degradans 2-40]
MSFELLDFVNRLIIEETQDLPASQLVAETDPKYLPTDERVNRFRSITQSVISAQRKARLTEYRSMYEEYKKQDSLYHRALASLPESVEQVFQQIVAIVTSGGDTVPKGWTMAHREEVSGKDNDEEMKKIWVRMYMLGLIEDERAS